ncbi:hypothetical protein DPMN_161457 [Dreissena polymorpha]|uniref:Uncharacterized protein n=1 Tax=Dreissena polymorpha TaxID=45954 RepID=A0A9D4EMQ7_DREPO|nr:hypothetical protein DPMN_161457 [Dreissena polymorpha]
MTLWAAQARTAKFVGRQIRHKWIVDKETKKSKWYIGTVIDVVSGKDGDPQAVHEVLYKGEDNPYEVDGLQRDLDEGSLKFVDI